MPSVLVDASSRGSFIENRKDGIPNSESLTLDRGAGSESNVPTRRFYRYENLPISHDLSRAIVYASLMEKLNRQLYRPAMRRRCRDYRRVDSHHRAQRPRVNDGRANAN